MKLYTCTDHAGHWPVGTASIVIARSEREARELLTTALREAGLPVDREPDFTLRQVPLTTPVAIVLNDGDY